jgi:hypothetical protein
MKTKEKYKAPEIVLIALDNEISLQLNSDPTPLGEPDWMSYSGAHHDPMLDL